MSKDVKKKTGYPSIDKPWLKYYDTNHEEYSIPKQSIYQLAKELNKDKMKNIVFDIRRVANDYFEEKKITYGDFFDEISKSAKASHSIGINPNDIVLMLFPNIPEARTIIYSNSFLGATTYPISPFLPETQLEKIILENNVDTIFIHSFFWEKYKSVLNNPILRNVIVLGNIDSNSSKSKSGLAIKPIFWEEYLNYHKHVKNSLTSFYEDGHVALIIGTSGTTGVSKGVCLTDENLNAAALSYKLGKVFEGSFLDALIPSISYGAVMSHLQIIDSKYTYIIPELLTNNTAKALCTIKPDVFAGGPVHYINISESDEFNNNMLPKRNIYLSGGATLPKDVELKLNGVNEQYNEESIDDNIIVRQGYALSESCGLGSIAKRGAYKFGSVGIPMLFTNISIFTPDTDEELGYYEKGEICITGFSVMQGYLNNVEETNKVIKVHKDGKRWIHTKDIGYMDENGHIFHLERIKNIFMRTGFNVHPSAISEFLNTIPFVKNSYVIGFEHPQEQCVPIAFVVANEDCGKSNEEIEKYIHEECYKNLEETSVPYGYVFVDALPINLGGKIDGKKIQEVSEIDLMKEDKIPKKELFFG